MTGPLSRTIISTYGLAFLGVHLAFMPLLVLLLPRRVEMLAGENAASVLSLLLLIGGVVAGIANIIAGAVSDKWYARFGTRRGLIAIGAGLIGVAYIGFAMAGVTRGVFVGLVTAIGMLPFVGLSIEHLWAVVFFAVGASLMLSLLGLSLIHI